MEIARRQFLRQAGAALAVGLLGRRRVDASQGAAAAIAAVAAAKGGQAKPPGGLPNIVYILADDMGYGDVRCLNKDGKVPTPHMDRLASEGMVFTDAHSGSAVCTPTRYGVLTGRYSWRTHLASGVLMGYSPPLIDPRRLTVASLLKRHGYYAACLGKWHLGMEMATKDGGRAGGDGANVDFAKPIAGGPTAVGFDHYFGIAASLDMPPYVYIQNDRFVAVPTTQKTWIRRGWACEDFEAVNVLPDLTRKAVEYIDARAKAGGPFFLYLALSAPHTPILPAKDFAGKTGIGDYGDFVHQVDATVGQVCEALKRNGLADGTLVIVTSDNGCSPAADFKALGAKGHDPSYHFRGAKADIFEGGHRIPFIARWPGKVRPGSTCGEMVCLTDLMATCAAILGEKLPDGAGEDSVSILPALLGQAAGPLREATVHHSINGSFSIRQGQWKLELCGDSGGWSAPRPGTKDAVGLPPIQLYDLTQDVGERTNVQDKHPEVVERLTKLLERYVADGRSTPGAAQKNDRQVSLRPPAAKAAKAGKAAASSRSVGG